MRRASPGAVIDYTRIGGTEELEQPRPELPLPFNCALLLDHPIHLHSLVLTPLPRLQLSPASN